MSDSQLPEGLEPALEPAPEHGAEARSAPRWRRAWDAARGRVVPAARSAVSWSAERARRVVRSPLWGRARSRLAAAVARVLPVAGFGARVALGAIVLAALALGAGWLCLQRVEPTTIGVRQSRWGGGYEQRDYEVGLHFGLRPLTTWYALDARTHMVAFAHRSDGGTEPMLRVRTKDGNVARVAASVPYRIRPNEGHRLVAKGLRTTYPELVEATVKKTLLVELAHLTSDDLCDTGTRSERVRATLPRLNEALAEYHVEAESIELRMVFFPQEYESELQKKQLSRQLVLLADAEKELKDQESAVSQIEMEIEAEVLILHADKKKDIAEIVARHQQEIGPLERQAETYRTTRAAEAAREHARLEAEGDIALHEAEAERTKLFAAAYGSPGGRLYLAREAARRLRVKEVELDSRDPDVPSMLDLDELVKLLVGSLE